MPARRALALFPGKKCPTTGASPPGRPEQTRAFAGRFCRTLVAPRAC